MSTRTVKKKGTILGELPATESICQGETVNKKGSNKARPAFLKICTMEEVKKGLNRTDSKQSDNDADRE